MSQTLHTTTLILTMTNDCNTDMQQNLLYFTILSIQHRYKILVSLAPLMNVLTSPILSPKLLQLRTLKSSRNFRLLCRHNYIESPFSHGIPKEDIFDSYKIIANWVSRTRKDRNTFTRVDIYKKPK